MFDFKILYTKTDPILAYSHAVCLIRHGHADNGIK